MKISPRRLIKPKYFARDIGMEIKKTITNYCEAFFIRKFITRWIKGAEIWEPEAVVILM